MTLDLSRHSYKSRDFQKCGNTAFCHRPWIQRSSFEDPSAPSPCRGSGRQGTHRGRLSLCPSPGHHNPCPGPESSFLFLISWKSHQMHPPSSTSFRSLSLCPGFTKPILFGVGPPDSYARLRSSHFFRSLSNEPSCWLKL